MARIMAFDYGLKRTGVAVTDPAQIIATPLDVIDSENVLKWIFNYVKSENVDEFVVGIPIQADGSPSESHTHVMGFKKRLAKNFPEIPITEMDERYTTKLARNVINQSGVNKRKRQEKGLDDKISACIILQSYMDTKK